MGVGKVVRKAYKNVVKKPAEKVLGKKLAKAFNPIGTLTTESTRLLDKVENKAGEWIAGKPPEAPDMESLKTASDVGEGGLESAAIRLGHKRKRLSLAKPTGRSKSSSKTQGTGVGVQV